MRPLTFIQMSGVPGSGKTTIATALARHTGAVIIDHDITKTALLESGVSIEVAGRASYGVLKMLARHLLSQGQSIIFDSPCFYKELLAYGQATAAEFAAEYRYIECVLDDFEELEKRLKKRQPLRSQRLGISEPPVDVQKDPLAGEKLFQKWHKGMQRPDGGYLLLDTSESIAVCVAKALAYLATPLVEKR